MKARFDEASDETAAPIDAANGSSGRKRKTGAVRKFYTIEQVAEEHEVSFRTVQRWIAEGDLIAHRFRRAVRIAEPDLADFQARNRD